MPLITEEQRAQLLANGARGALDEPDHDPYPVVRLFFPGTNLTWLLTELLPHEPDIAFGLCDLGIGFPELGHVSLSELESLRHPLGLKVERDLHFIADRPLSVYATEARYTAGL
jgi:hypothetical protein